MCVAYGFDGCTRFATALVLAGLVAACGGGGEGEGEGPSISIQFPTSDPTYSTTGTSVRLGGAIARASFVHVTNAATGTTVEGFVNYSESQGSWFADMQGLALGENPITVLADRDGTGATTARAFIVVIRPLEPVNLVFNGPSQNRASTFWTDASSFGHSHKIALFADGTGRSTTGSVLSEAAGGVTDFTWNKLGPDAIQISNCPNCSFQKISRISGSLEEAIFFGEIETVGGAGEAGNALHAFVLTDGNL